jgi:glycosyltransferase involved in cell wall biosynthesis
MPYKRHGLAVQVPRLRLVMAGPKEAEFDGALLHARTLFPSQEMNERELTPDEVVRALNSARCGLCLSASEGAMYAAIEYLLCGLPIVTTWNVGGRDWWLSGDYAIWCDATPAAVAAAVREMAGRNLSPQYVRQTALERIRRERLHFFSIVADALAEYGVSMQDVEAAFNREFTDKANYQPRRLSYFIPFDAAAPATPG